MAAVGDGVCVAAPVSTTWLAVSDANRMYLFVLVNRVQGEGGSATSFQKTNILVAILAHQNLQRDCQGHDG